MSMSYYVQVIVSLGILAGVLYGVLRFTKYAQKAKYTEDIKVIDRVPLNQSVSLLIVKVKDKEYLLGVSGKDVQILEKY